MPKYDSYDYNTMGFGNDPLHSNDSNGVGGVLGFVDDALGSVLFGDPDASSSIFGELTGYNAQQREFAQQEYMQEKQWAYDHPAAQMERMRQAGINLNTAAAGIAGGNVSAGAPAVGSPSGSPAAGLSAAVGAVNAGVGVAKAASEIKNNEAQANNQQASADKINEETPYVGLLANGQNMKYFADYVQGLKDVGLAEINAGGIAFDMLKGGLQKSLDYLSLCSGLRNIDETMKNVKVQYELMKKDADYGYDLKLNSSLSLQDKQGLQAAATAAKLKAETWYQEQKNQLEKSLPGVTMLQGGSFLTNLAWKYGVDSPQFEAAEKGFYNYAYQSNLGQYDADIDTAFSRFYNQAKAKADVDAAFAPYMKKIDVIGNALQEFTRAMMENPSSIDGAITTFINKIFVSLYGTQINFDPVNSATLPTSGNADRSNR